MCKHEKQHFRSMNVHFTFFYFSDCRKINGHWIYFKALFLQPQLRLSCQVNSCTISSHPFSRLDVFHGIVCVCVYSGCAGSMVCDLYRTLWSLHVLSSNTCWSSGLGLLGNWGVSSAACLSWLLVIVAINILKMIFTWTCNPILAVFLLNTSMQIIYVDIFQISWTTAFSHILW